MLIESERLQLRSINPGDKTFFITCLMDPDFMAFSPSDVLDEAAALERFNQLVNQPSEFAKLAVLTKSDAQLIGYCGVCPCEIESKPEIELGYRLVKSAQGQGFATEAASAVLEHYARKGIQGIIAFTEPHNLNSIRVLQKLGFHEASRTFYGSMPVIVFRR